MTQILHTKDNLTINFNSFGLGDYDLFLRAKRLPESRLSYNYETDKKQFIPESLRWEIFDRDNFTCQICGTRRLLTIDHIKPEKLGGTQDKENLQTLCKSCNSKKGTQFNENK